MTVEPKSLIERVKAGDRAALHRLLDHCRPDVYAAAYRILGNADDAHDVCQNALVELSFRLRELREAEALNGFVRQLVLHQCFDFRRRRATRRVPGPTWDQASLAAEDENVEERLAIHEALDTLPASQREALLLDLLAGMSHAEISQRLGVSIPTVRARLQSAKRQLKKDLRSLQQDPHMQPEPIVQQLVDRALPGALIQNVEPDPEMWLPYHSRIELADRSLVVRKDVDLAMAALLPELERQGIAVPRLLAGPELVAGTPWTLWEAPNGDNLTRWTMDGTYHRFRAATDIALEALDTLAAFTETAERLGLPRETLQDRFGQLEKRLEAWGLDPRFTNAIETLAPFVASSERPLVYTNYLHFFPNFLRIQEGKLGEIVYPFGRLEDPLLSLAMVWIYDCYPFVHTGFVEQYLVRHDIGKREFAIRLGVQALTILARETKPGEGENPYQESLFGLLERAYGWLR